MADSFEDVEADDLSLLATYVAFKLIALAV